jgi:IclR family transcriptional regulator, KDG regulon repressor
VEIRSVTKAVRLLEALSKESGPQGVSDLARQLKMDKSSVSRMLRTLEQGSLVACDETTGRYTLGLGLVHLGQRVLRRLDLRTVARSSLVTLVQKTHECAHLAVRTGDRALYVDQETPGRGVNVDAPVGTLAPLHCTALGKILLAFAPERVQESVLQNVPIESFTRRTLTDPAALQSHLASVRSRQVAFDDEEFSVGVRCMAAPVFRHDNLIIGAVGISGPSPRFSDDRMREWETILRDEALALSRKLGSTDPDLEEE